MTQLLPHRARNACHLHARPTTPLGVKSVRLVATGLLVTLSFAVLIAVSGDRPSPVSQVAPYVALAGLLAVLVGGAMAVLAITRRRERSIAAIATTPLFALALAVFVGELLQLIVWLLSGADRA